MVEVEIPSVARCSVNSNRVSSDAGIAGFLSHCTKALVSAQSCLVHFPGGR